MLCKLKQQLHMPKFKLKSDKFIICRFNDGILVSIMATSNASSYARQIHRIVSKNTSKDFFASDLAEMIDCPKSQKEIILNTLFVYSENGISISGVNICEIHGKNRMEIQHNGEVFLVIKSRKCYVSRIFLLIIFAVIVVNVFDHIKSYVELDSANDTEQAEVDDSSYPITVNDNSNQVSLPSSPDMTTELDKLNDVNIQEEAVNVDDMIETATVVNDSNQHNQSNVLSKVNNSKTATTATPSGPKSTIEGTLTDESLVANEILSKAERAYNKYLMTLDENDGIKALHYYERTLESINYLPNKKEEIVERINILKEVIN